MELVDFQLSDLMLTIVFVLILSFLAFIMYASYKSDRPSDK